jgi:hypothetical protein
MGAVQLLAPSKYNRSEQASFSPSLSHTSHDRAHFFFFFFSDTKERSLSLRENKYNATPARGTTTQGRTFNLRSRSRNVDSHEVGGYLHAAKTHNAVPAQSPPNAPRLSEKVDSILEMCSHCSVKALEADEIGDIIQVAETICHSGLMQSSKGWDASHLVTLERLSGSIAMPHPSPKGFIFFFQRQPYLRLNFSFSSPTSLHNVATITALSLEDVTQKADLSP